MRLLLKGFSRINKIKGKIIYFYSLSVNYNNRSPAVGNDSKNGINRNTTIRVQTGTKNSRSVGFLL